MTLPTYYNTGTASVNNGATTVTGTGTGWGSDSFGTPVIAAGDFFMDPAQPEIPPQRIASVTDATHLVLARPWPGANVSGPYEVQFVGDIVRSTAQTRRYLERLGQLAAFGIQPNAFGNFADRSAFDGEAKGYIFLSLDGDSVSNVWTLYIKRSAAAGDWDDGQSLVGPSGEQGETGLVAEWLGPWVAGTYPPLKGVTHNGSSYISKIETSQEPPHADWDVQAAKGDPGPNGTDGKFSGIEIVKTTAFTALAADVGKTFILDKATADTLSFDSVAALGSSWMVMVKNVGAGIWSLDPSGSETIDGAATISLTQGQSVVVSCNGTGLRTLSGGLPVTGGTISGQLNVGGSIAGQEAIRVFNMIDVNAVMRVWRFQSLSSGGPSVELVHGTGPTAGDSANTWWDFFTLTSGGTPGTDRFGIRRRTGGAFSELISLDGATGLCRLFSLGLGAPVTKTADFTVAATENYLINNKSAATCTVTLPAASSWTGRIIMIKNIQAQTVVSASSNVVPLSGGAAGAAILSANVGRWAELVSNGTNWEIMTGVI